MKPVLIRATVLTLFLLQLTAVVRCVLLECPGYEEENCGCTLNPYFMRTCTQNDETIEMTLDLSNVSSSFEFLCSNIDQGQVFDSLNIDTIGLISSMSSAVTINACPSSVVTRILSSVLKQTNSSSLTLIVNNLTTLSHDIFSFEVQLLTLSIRGDKLKELPENIFQFQTSLKELNLSGNQIDNLHPNIFYNISLVKLDLTDNKLMKLHLDIISIESLEKIALDGNLFECSCDFLTKYYEYEKKFDLNDICDGMSFDQKLLSLTCMDNDPLGTVTWGPPPTRLPYPWPTKATSTTLRTTKSRCTTSHRPDTTTKAPLTTTTTTTIQPKTTTKVPATTTTTIRPGPPKPTPSSGTLCLIVIIVLLISIAISLAVHYYKRKYYPNRYETLN